MQSHLKSEKKSNIQLILELNLLRSLPWILQSLLENQNLDLNVCLLTLVQENYHTWNWLS